MWSSTPIKRYVQVSVQSFRPEIQIMKKDLSGCDRRMNEKVQIGVQNLEVEQSENDMGQRFGEFHIHEVYAHIHKNIRSPITSVQCDMCNCRRMTAVGGISCMRPDAIDTIAQHMDRVQSLSLAKSYHKCLSPTHLAAQNQWSQDLTSGNTGVFLSDMLQGSKSMSF